MEKRSPDRFRGDQEIASPLSVPIVRFYSAAVQEGWAPTPTDTVQKAIWDKVNATPKTPMKIEFDPKKGR